MNRSFVAAALAVCFIAGCKDKAPPLPVEEPKPAPVAAAPAPVAAAPAVAPSGPIGWQQVDTETFSVEVPGAVEKKDGTEQTAAGPVKTTTWSSQTAGAFYAVSIADYPTGMMAAALPSKVLEGARDGAMANVGGKVERDFAVFLDSGTPKKKYPGREFDGSTTQGIRLAARLFLVDDRLYQMISVSPIASFNAADFKKFADSFKLKATAAAPADAPKPGKRTRK